MKRPILLVLTVAVVAALVFAAFRSTDRALSFMPRRECEPLKSVSPPNGPETLITLCFGQTKSLPRGETITFSAYDDQRCVRCSWEGAAWGTMVVAGRNGGPTRIRLPWSAGAYAWNGPVTFGGYDLELRRLEPYPSEDGILAPSSEYSALVAVRDHSDVDSPSVP